MAAFSSLTKAVAPSFVKMIDRGRGPVAMWPMTLRCRVVLLGRDVDGLAGRPHGHPLGLLAHGHAAQHLAGGEIEHGHLGRLLVRDVEDLAVAREVERLRVLPARVGADELAAG
jgi:hypothetical protein